MKTLSLYGGEATLDFNDAKHCYTWREKQLPVAGVTSILKLLDKPALIQWAANMAVSYIRDNWTGEMMGQESFEKICNEAKTAHRRTSKDAADIGTTVHSFAQRILETGRAALPSDPKAANGAQAFLSWFHAHEIKPISVERMFLSSTFWFAGTCDFFGHFDGKLCVLDFKTSSGLYLEMLLQLAAYAIALEEETKELVENGIICRLDKKTGKCQVYHIALTNQLKSAFIKVREAHQLIGKIEESLDGIRKQAA